MNIEHGELSRNIMTLNSLDSRHDEMWENRLDPTEKGFFEAAAEAALAIGKNRIHFWNMLVTMVHQTEYRPPLNRPTSILNLACGNCLEGLVLDSFFGGKKFGSSSHQVKLVGIDIDATLIAEAAFLNDNPNYQFMVGDATQLAAYPEIPTSADVVVLRHPHTLSDSFVWPRIFSQGLLRLNTEGLMIVTSYSQAEHELTLGILQQLGGRVIVNQENPHAMPFPNVRFASDQFVAILGT